MVCPGQGNGEDELPESLLGTVRFIGLDLNDAVPISTDS